MIKVIITQCYFLSKYIIWFVDLCSLILFPLFIYAHWYPWVFLLWLFILFGLSIDACLFYWYLFMIFFQIKYWNIWNWRIHFSNMGKNMSNLSVNAGWLIYLQVNNSFCNADKSLKKSLLPRFYNCPLLPPNKNYLAGKLPPT